jgi:hypothetical protein
MLILLFESEEDDDEVKSSSPIVPASSEESATASESSDESSPIGIESSDSATEREFSSSFSDSNEDEPFATRSIRFKLNPDGSFTSASASVVEHSFFCFSHVWV